MADHINQKSLTIAATSTSGATQLPDNNQNTGKKGLYIFNTDTTNIAYVAAGSSSIAATATGNNFVPPGQGRTFQRPLDATHIAVKMSAGAGANVLVVPTSID